MLYIFLAAGFFGGVARGLVGFIKHQFSYKNVGFRWGYFLGMAAISGMIGMMAAWSIEEAGFLLNGSFTWALSFIIGYAGGDFLENIYKIIISKSNFVKKK
ncbi:MAG: hypothetical protein AAB723_04405 [Patescibacteria group bacterium]